MPSAAAASGLRGGPAPSEAVAETGHAAGGPA
jgi:hypothetical protein